MKSGRIVAHKNKQGFHATKTNCTRRFMNERQPNLREHEGCWGWQRPKTSLLWLMWPSTQSIGKDIKASSLFTRRAVDVISEAFFSAMTGDRDDELAALTPSWLVCILTVMPVWLYFSYHSCFVLHFFFEHETIYAIRVLAEFDFYYRTSACNLSELENLQYSECPFRFVSGFSSLLTL